MKFIIKGRGESPEDNNVILGPWKSVEEKRRHKEFLIKNAAVANDISIFIIEHMKEVYGSSNPNKWTSEHFEVFSQIDNMLNILFPSGD